MPSITWQGYEPPVLLFVQTKERAKELFKELIFDNIMVDAIHADRTQLQVTLFMYLNAKIFLGKWEYIYKRN